MDNNTTEKNNNTITTKVLKETITSMINDEKHTDKFSEALNLFTSVNSDEDGLCFYTALKELNLSDEDYDNLISQLKKYSSYKKGRHLQNIKEDIDDLKCNFNSQYIFFVVYMIVFNILYSILQHIFG